MYQSPIEIIQKELATQYENGVLKAVQDFGFIVDAGELTKALMFDRNQYEKGYKDRDAEIIRCKDCSNSDWYKTAEGKTLCYCLEYDCGGFAENDFCSRAVKDRDCEHCTHHTEQGCTKWDCEFERVSE